MSYCCNNCGADCDQLRADLAAAQARVKELEHSLRMKDRMSMQSVDRRMSLQDKIDRAVAVLSDMTLDFAPRTRVQNALEALGG